MSYQISLEVFEGPFELLLHLIEKEEIDIYDIPIARITDQYLAYLRQMEQLDLDIASEFLLMAATLMEIKARMLLPTPVTETAAAAEPEIDARAELVQRLLEYKQFKQAAAELRNRAAAFELIYTREAADLTPYRPESNPLAGVTLIQLAQQFRQIIKHLPAAEQVHRVFKEKITVQERMVILAQFVQAHPEGVSFTEIFHGQATKLELIVTFLALLELIRLQEVRVRQEKNFGTIMICRVESENN